MLDHITFGVGDFARCADFYDKALAPLGISRLFEVTAEQTGSNPFIGYGAFVLDPEGRNIEAVCRTA